MTTDNRSDVVLAAGAIDLARLASPMLPNTARALASRADLELAAAKRMPAIDSDDMYALVIERGNAIAQLSKALEDDRTSVTKPLLALKKQWDDVFMPPRDTAEQALRILRGLAGAWLEAKRKAKAEAERIAAVERRRAEEERRAAIEEQERAARAELEQAVTKGDSGKALEAAKAIDDAERAATAPMPIVAPVCAPAPAPRIAGTSERKRWTWRHADSAVGTVSEIIGALVIAMTKDHDDARAAELLSLLLVDEAAITKRVTAMGEHVRIPGVHVFEQTSVAFDRSGRGGRR